VLCNIGSHLPFIYHLTWPCSYATLLHVNWTSFVIIIIIIMFASNKGGMRKRYFLAVCIIISKTIRDMSKVTVNHGDISFPWKSVTFWLFRPLPGSSIPRPIFAQNGSNDVNSCKYVSSAVLSKIMIMSLTHSLTAALDRLRVVAVSTTSDPGLRVDRHW